MSLHSVQEIEHAIGELSSSDLEELASWFDQREHPFDARLKADVAAGEMDDLLALALAEERDGLLRPL